MTSEDKTNFIPASIVGSVATTVVWLLFTRFNDITSNLNSIVILFMMMLIGILSAIGSGWLFNYYTR